MSNAPDPFDAYSNEMPTYQHQTPDQPDPRRPDAIDDATADGLLAGHGSGPLFDLLFAARASGTQAELSGERAALAAFRSAAAAAPQRAIGHRRPVLRRLVAIKVGAIAAAVVAGVAVAATVGALPNPLTPDPAPIDSGSTSTSWSTQPGQTGTTTTLPPQTTPSPTGPATGPDSKPGTGPSPTAALSGLCSAYLAHQAAHPGQPWNSPAYATLSAAAGGDSNVGPFCLALVGGQSSPSPSPASSSKPGNDKSEAGETPTRRPTA